MIYYRIETSLSDVPIIADTMSIATDPPHAVYCTNWTDYWKRQRDVPLTDRDDVKRMVKYIPWHCIKSIELIKGD